MVDEPPQHLPASSSSGPAPEQSGRAVQLISIDAEGKCHVQPEAVALLDSLEGRVAVVGIAGLYRTGKSFLLNRLLNRQQGFEIGPTVHACTKGLWMWDTPVRLEGGASCVFVDTEGLGSAQRTASCDMQIFSLCVLLSSYFVYNCMGAIDEQAIDDLHLVLHLAQHIHTKREHHGQSEQITREELSTHFPGLLWVVRDFHLRLVDDDGRPISQKAYLENALMPLPGQEEKNRLRETIKALFHDRDCITLVRPVADEENLRRVNELKYEELREPFRQQVEDFVKKVFASAKPKEVNGTICSGAIIAGLCKEYCAAINNSVVPNIQSAWHSVVQQQLRQSLQLALQTYKAEMRNVRIPLNEDALRDAHKAAKAEALRMFTLPKFHDDEPRLLEFREDLLRRIKQQYDSLKADNANASTKLCEAVAHELYGDKIESKLLSKSYHSLEDLMKDWTELRDEYLARTNGPAQGDVLGSWIFQRMSESCSRVNDYLHVQQVEKPETELEGGMLYTGQWQGQKRHGQGLLRRPDGSSYEGTFVESRAHGYGKYVTANGNVYLGQWQQDQTHGYGKYVQTDGTTYEGEWHHNQKSGRGIEIWPDGAKYEGEYVANCKHGVGTYTSGSAKKEAGAPRAMYDGQFRQDVMDGEGRYLAEDGCQLSGQWRGGHMSGKGQALWPDGSKYVGYYIRDLKSGEGTFYWPDGRMYHGQWREGKQNGVGRLIDHVGLETRGTWEDGRQIAAESSSVGAFTGNLSVAKLVSSSPPASSPKPNKSTVPSHHSVDCPSVTQHVASAQDERATGSLTPARPRPWKSRRL